MCRCSKPVVASVCFAVLLGLPTVCFPWGREGHEIIVMLAENYMLPETSNRMRKLLAPQSLEAASAWADEYRTRHRETAAWHYINIPLMDSVLDLGRECAHGDCVVAKTEEFTTILNDPGADRDAKAQALKFVIHLVGDLHQPLHDEDNGDKGGNSRRVIFGGRLDNLHWVWDAGLLQHMTRDPAALAALLKARITARDQQAWEKGSIEDWVMEGHQLAQAVAYGDLPTNENPASITAQYERQADAVIKLQLERAGVRLAYLLDANLKYDGAANTAQSERGAAEGGNPIAKVWVNTKTATYHCSGTRWYGKTKEGEYMTQKEAEARGYRSAHQTPCQ